MRVASNTIAAVARRALPTLVALALLAGCARTSGSVHPPSACTGGATADRVAAIRVALAKAPGPVALRDGTRISDCLARLADSGDVQTVGSMMLALTQRLADEASGAAPDQALTQLGYVIGAVQRGAAHAPGVDSELVRRLEQELAAVDTGSAAYRAGERAGRATG